MTDRLRKAPKEKSLPLVAIIGRPNVGKSTLFNRLIGERRAIVGDEPGITRDRIYGEANWRTQRFALVDTGGIVPDDEAVIPANILKQASFAIDDAQALIWVVDARVSNIRGAGSTVSENQNAGGTPALPFRELRLAIVGRPNVGKSSLLNRLLGEERAIVSPVAGTTRDTVDTLLEIEGQSFRIIDTAGIRRKGKTEAMAEKLSVVMARKSLERADVAIVVLDAEQGIAALDAAIAGYAVEAGCSIIVVVNKWDTIENKDTHTGSEFERKVRDQMKFLNWASVVTISALTGQRVQKLLPLVVAANQARNIRISTSRLNEFFEREITHGSGIMPARPHGGSRLRVQYITQIGIRPPTFVVFTAGGKAGLHFSFVRHLENRMREEFGFLATPIRFVERHKSKRRR